MSSVCSLVDEDVFVIIMPKLRDVRNALLASWEDGNISDYEFCILYNLNKFLDDYPYWHHDRFDLDTE